MALELGHALAVKITDAHVRCVIVLWSPHWGDIMTLLYRLATAIAAFGFCCLLMSFGSEQADGFSNAALAENRLPMARPVIHRRRGQSLYCYPKTLWWFYRPYTTAPMHQTRCMPYFHYPVQPQRHGGPGIANQQMMAVSRGLAFANAAYTASAPRDVRPGDLRCECGGRRSPAA